MKIEINIEKKHVYILSLLVILISAATVFAAWDSSKPSHATLYTNSIESKTVNGNLGMIFNKIGIGTTNPAVKLDVIGDIKASSSIFAGGKKVLTGLGACIDVRVSNAGMNNDHAWAMCPAGSVVTGVLYSDSYDNYGVAHMKCCPLT